MCGLWDINFEEEEGGGGGGVQSHLIIFPCFCLGREVYKK